MAKAERFFSGITIGSPIAMTLRKGQIWLSQLSRVFRFSSG